MSLDSPARPRTASTSRSTSAFAGSPRFPAELLHPCTATAAYFLFSQGTTVVVLHHDTLAIERRFEGHRAKIVFITADNVSERGAGRLVVSYDASQTAIVWDLFTGNEISRFASFELICACSWMRNGNVAFGSQIPPSRRAMMFADGLQATQKVKLFFSSHQHPSTSPRRPYPTLSRRWHLLQIVKDTQSGELPLSIPISNIR